MSARAAAVRIAIVVLQLAVLVCVPACCNSRNLWRGPTFALPRTTTAETCHQVARIEQLYARAFELQEQNCVKCVDYFYEVALRTAHRECGECEQCGCESTQRMRQLHDSALQKLVDAGQKFHRLDPRTGLTVVRDGERCVIPVKHHGFVWKADDFTHLIPVGDYLTKSISKFYRRCGVGVPMVVKSCRRSEGTFRPQWSAFAATLRLSVPSNACPDKASPSSTDAQLDLYDPLRVDVAEIDGSPHPIAKDLSAPIAYGLHTKPRNYLTGFLRPTILNPDADSTEGGMYTLEPYQPGKIPIVLIHGLLSDPYTWSEMANECLASPGFIDHFQIWVYVYPTGRPFLSSAAQLRKELEEASRKFDPTGSDPELSNMILVGHSMGGLVAKLQITSSGDRLWRAAANRPFGQVVMTDEVRRLLSQTFFFEPSPRVSRVVYMATPHRGSAFATRLIGRLGSYLVQEPEETEKVHRALIRDNPGVFSREVRRRSPTSIDLLEPKSKLLLALDALPVRCGVAMHSIIGNHCWTCSLGRSDGVVPVENAIERRAITQRFVDATHSGVKENSNSVEEVFAILDLHLKQSEHRAEQSIAAEAADNIEGQQLLSVSLER